jgi:hypothetical protein
MKKKANKKFNKNPALNDEIRIEKKEKKNKRQCVRA